MSDQHPAVVYLLAAHERAEAVARRAAKPALDHCPSDPVEFVIGMNDLSTPAVRAAEAHIRLHPTSAVLTRVAAEREILAEHAAGDMARERDETECRTCSEPQLGFSGMWAAEHPCRTVLGLAKAWGWEAET
jgi:hypothetical protein